MRSAVNLAASIASLVSEYQYTYDGARRHLQPPLPDYTSPPTDYALAATPDDYRNDTVIDAGREADANGTCFENVTVCQIPFVPPAVESPRLGVVFYCGALVDPRGYSPIAKELSERYGIAVAIQIFEADLAFSMDSCDTGRVKLAAELFPSVEKWALAGHSFGGIAAMADVWTAQNDSDSKIGGLALLASYVRQDVGCGEIDFSTTQIPMASINATLDGIVNSTTFQQGQTLLPVNDTFHLEILGGNHGQFGSYDDSERTELLGQVDGEATIPEKVQLDLTVSAIAHVASRMGIPLPELEKIPVEEDMTSDSEVFRVGGFAVLAMTSVLVYFLLS